VSRFPTLTEGMVARGYSDSDIEKILGANDLRVFKKVLT
jgi:microsomal dipeptidase-like Zn-dependent dipeptidase